MIAAYQRRRDLAVEMLNACRGLNCHKPEGAFYVFPNVAGCLGKTTPAGRHLATDVDFALALLEEAHVATVHGVVLRHEPLSADQHGFGRIGAGRGLPPDRGLLREPAVKRHDPGRVGMPTRPGSSR